MARNGYQQDRDELLVEIGTTASGIMVQIRSYDGGDPKVAIVKPGSNGRFRNVGRMTQSQVKEVLPLLDQADDFFRAL
jgi:hypothetical protein